MASDLFRELLVADLALVLDVVPARHVAAAVERYWDEREQAAASLSAELQRAAGLGADDLRKLEREVDRIVAEAGGDSRTAFHSRGGIDTTLFQSFSGRLPVVREDRYRDWVPIEAGGMGLVYLALDTELNRTVAVKLARPWREMPRLAEMDPLSISPPAGDVREEREFSRRAMRLLQEVWVIGGLEHPGILPVYESGRTRGGVPYYTMQYVRGERTLLTAIEEARSIEDRLALLDPLLEVLDTIRYAHSRGVIHRDLKPANIAVGKYGEVMVLDWGLATARNRPDLAGELAPEPPSRDEVGGESLPQALGTPGYMSPEAARVTSHEIDERSDVYGLGATLYLILVGRLPFEFSGLAELERKLRDEDPIPPTRRWDAVPEALSDICRRALARDPADRFESVEALSNAVREWRQTSAREARVAALADQAETVLSTAESLSGAPRLERLDRVAAIVDRIRELDDGAPCSRELSRRCRAARDQDRREGERRFRGRVLRRVGVAVLVLICVAAVPVVLTLRERKREAEASRAEAEELAQFMLFDMYGRLKPLGRLDLLEPVARKLLAYYEGRSMEEVDPQTLRRHALALVNMSEVLHEQGDTVTALRGFERAREMQERLVLEAPGQPEFRRDLASTLSWLAEISYRRGDLDHAHALYSRSSAIAERLSTEYPERVDFRELHSNMIAWLGNLELRRGDLNSALKLYEKALRARRGFDELGPLLARLYGESLTDVGFVHEQKGDLILALTWYRRALDLQRGLAERHPDDATIRDRTAKTLRSIAGVLLKSGESEEALAHTEEALRISRDLSELDPASTDRRYTLANALRELGDLQVELDGAEAACASHGEAIEILRGILEKDPDNTVWLRALYMGQERLGDIESRRKRPEAAEAHYRASLAARRRLAELDPESGTWRGDLALGLMRIGECRMRQEDPAAAISNYREALEIEQVLVKEDPDRTRWRRELSFSWQRIAGALTLEGDRAGAGQALRHALNLHRELVRDGPSIVLWRQELGSLHSRIAYLGEETGDREKALLHFRSSAEIFEELARGHPMVANRWASAATTRGQAGNQLFHLKRYGEAHREYLVSRESRRREVALDPTRESLLKWHDERCHESGILSGDVPPEGAAEHLAVGRRLRKEGRYAEALPHLDAALGDEAVRADLAGGVLYEAARCAALASWRAKGEARVEYRALALAWLEEDVDLRRGRIEAIEKELAKDPPPDDAAGMRKSREELLHLIEFARDTDIELAEIRDTPEFAAVFRE